MATAVAAGVSKLVSIVVDNASYGTIRMHQEREYPGRVSGSDLFNPDFAALARAYGWHSEFVERTEQFEPALERWLAAGRPGLLHLKLDTDVITSRTTLAAMADGDARRLLGLLELAADIAPDGVIDEAVLRELAGESWRRFDKGGEAFYDQISALHKSVRGSNPDAALYWLVRMLDGGADPRYMARRLVRMASEDIGLADPRALRITLDAAETYERLGSPEGELTLAQALERAAESYRRATELNPRYLNAYIGLGNTWKALSEVRIAKGLDPSEAVGRAGALVDHLEVRARVVAHALLHVADTVERRVALGLRRRCRRRRSGARRCSSRAWPRLP